VCRQGQRCFAQASKLKEWWQKMPLALARMNKKLCDTKEFP
jgi:hypothetical protein